MKVIAGSWLIASVCIERMKQMSSTILALLRQQFGNPHAALAMLGELVLRRRDGKARLTRGHRRQTLAHADRFGQVLVVPLVHHRLVVEQVHLRRPADHVQVDDVLRFAGEMLERFGFALRSIGCAVVSHCPAAHAAFFAEKRGERGPAGDAAGFAEELTTRFGLDVFLCGMHMGFPSRSEVTLRELQQVQDRKA